jgi:transcriptional regulator CtsR
MISHDIINQWSQKCIDRNECHVAKVKEMELFEQIQCMVSQSPNLMLQVSW